MKTAILLLAIAVTTALIALVAVNVRIRDLQHQIHRQRKRVRRTQQMAKKIERQNTAFLEALKGLARKQR